MAFTQFKLDVATEQSRGIFNQYVYETTDTVAETQETDYFAQSRFASLDPDWFGSFITCKCSDGIFTGEITTGGTITPIPTGSDPTFTTLTEGQVPKTNATEQLIYGGATVDPTTEEWTFDKAINVPAGTINIGEAVSLSEGKADLIVVDRIKDKMAFSVNSDFDEATGSAVPTFTDFGAPFTLNLQPDDSTVITTNPLSLQITGTVVAPDIRLIDQITLRANGAMTNFRVKITDNATGLALRYIPSKTAFETGTGGFNLIAGDNTFFLASDAANTPGNFHLGFVPFIIEDSQIVDLVIQADAVDLLGDAGLNPFIVLEAHDGPPVALQTSGGVTLTPGSVPFANIDGHLTDDNTSLRFDDVTKRLTVANVTVTGDALIEGTTTIINTENLSVKDSFIDLNAGLTAVLAKEGGLSVNYLPTATNDTVTAGAFVAGIASTSNPTVTTDTATVFTVGEIIQITGTLNSENDGTYEVLSHAANLLTIRGIGVTGTVESFSRNQFTANASDSALITNINVTVIRTATDGEWETGKGSVTGIVYTSVNALIPGGSDTQVQFNNNGALGGISGITTDGTNLDVSGRIDGAGTGGLLDLKGADNSPTGGPVRVRGGGASNVGGKVELIGGSGTNSGGNIELRAGEGPNTTGGSVISIAGNAGSDDGSGVGGDIVQTAGDGGFDSGAAGNVILTGGNGNINGGDVVLTGGVGTTSEGGTVFIAGGASTNSEGGSIDLTAGNAGTAGPGGDVVLLSGSASGSGEDSGRITIDAGTTVDGNVSDVLMQRATGKVGIGVNSVVPSAQLEVSSASRGFLMPRMTTAERDNISSPATGLEIYNISNNEPEFFNGSTWSATAGAETLAATLANGNETGGSDLSVSAGDSIVSADAATPTSAGRPLLFKAGSGGATSGDGGFLDFLSGNGQGTNADSGSITMDTGTPGAGGNIGPVLMQRFNGSVGVGVALAPVPSAKFEITSISSGFLMPRMTTTQRDAISSPATGLYIYNTTTNEPNYFNGSVWSTSLVGNLAETLALGNTSGGTDLVMSPGDKIETDLIEATTVTVGTGGSLILSHAGADGIITNVVNDLILDNFSLTGDIVAGLGTDSSATKFIVKNDSDIVMWSVDGAGDAILNGRLTLEAGDILSPDGASGVAISITSGAGTAGAGGALNLTAGNGTLAAGDINVLAGNTTGSLGVGGKVNIQGGNGVLATTGGDVLVFAGTGGASDGTGGQTVIHGGSGGGPNGDGGAVEIEAGDSGATSGNGGALALRSGSGSSNGGVLNVIAGDGTFSGGALNVISGNVTGSGVAGTISIKPGISGGASVGGKIQILGGVGGDANGAGGDVVINAGLGGNTNGNGGELLLDGGVNSGSGAHGNVVIAGSGGRVGVGTATPNAPFDVAGDSPGTVGGFASGALHITNPSALVNANAVITGHNSFGGNKQLWYLGSGSSSNDNITLINRQNGELSFGTNNITRLTISSTGDINLNAYPNTRDDGTPINILGTDASGNLISGPNEVIHIGGNFVDTTDQTISVVSTAQDITFNTNSLIDDISHTIGSATFTINTDGVYNLIIAPQLAQGAGAATVEFWVEKNGTAIVNSNVQESIAANSQSLPLLRWKERFVSTDTFKIKWASDSLNTTLDNITSTYGGPNIPSIMLGVTQIGS